MLFAVAHNAFSRRLREALEENRMTNIMTNNKGCGDGCSFYRVSYKIESLPPEKQIEIEEASKNGNLNLKQNYELLFNTQTKTCIGGLLTDGTLRKKCSYFSIHPDKCSESDLIQYFIAQKSAKQSIPWKIATLVLALATLILGILTFISQTDKENKKLIDEQKVAIDNINTENAQLKNKVKTLKKQNLDLKQKNDILSTGVNKQ